MRSVFIIVLLCCLFSTSKAQLFVETPISGSHDRALDTNAYMRDITSWHVIGIRFFVIENWFLRLGYGGSTVNINRQFFHNHEKMLFADISETYLKSPYHGGTYSLSTGFADYGIGRVLYRRQAFSLQIMADHRIQRSTLGILDLAAFHEVEPGLYNKAYKGTAELNNTLEHQFQLKTEVSLMSETFGLFFALGAAKHFYPTYNVQLYGQGISGQGKTLTASWTPTSQWFISTSFKLIYRLRP